MSLEDAQPGLPGWPLSDLRLAVGDLRLRQVRERDLATLADLLPDDHEHDPRPERWPGHDLVAHRRRLTYQGHWSSLGSWSPGSWALDLLVEEAGAVVGVQSLEAADFTSLRTVDSGSWLVPSVRGRGVGVLMRSAVLALAFDGLDAVAAVTSARSDNLASLGVSRHLGYEWNGTSRTGSDRGVVELEHRRLSADRWRARPRPTVRIEGLAACRSWFVAPAQG